MCRWMAWFGQPVLIDEVLFKTQHGIVNDQSLHACMGAEPTNGDGFGLGWYGSGEGPALYHSVAPPWGDANLRELAGHIESPLFLAHVRGCSSTTAISPTSRCSDESSCSPSTPPSSRTFTVRRTPKSFLPRPHVRARRGPDLRTRANCRLHRDDRAKRGGGRCRAGQLRHLGWRQPVGRALRDRWPPAIATTIVGVRYRPPRCDASTQVNAERAEVLAEGLHEGQRDRRWAPLIEPGDDACVSDKTYMAHIDLLARARGSGAGIARTLKRADLADRTLHPSARASGWSPPYEFGLEILLQGASGPMYTAGSGHGWAERGRPSLPPNRSGCRERNPSFAPSGAARSCWRAGRGAPEGGPSPARDHTTQSATQVPAMYANGRTGPALGGAPPNV